MSKHFFVPTWLGVVCFILSISTSSLCEAKKPDGTSMTPSATASAPAQTHTVQVGLADHKFRPEVTLAEIGDTVEFRFYPTNHSVVHAEYGFPCIPSEMVDPSKPSFFSGFHSSDKVSDNPETFRFKINDTNPIFFYCSAPGSCTTFGMIGAINPNATTSIDTQRQLAKDSAYQLSPGEPFPDEGPRPSSAPDARINSLQTPTSTPAPAPAPAESTIKSRPLSAGAIAGIAAAGTALVVLAALLFFFLGRTKTLQDEVERKDSSLGRRPGSAEPLCASHSRATSQSTVQHNSARGSTAASPISLHGQQELYTPLAPTYPALARTSMNANASAIPPPLNPYPQEPQELLTTTKFTTTEPPKSHHPAFSPLPSSSSFSQNALPTQQTHLNALVSPLSPHQNTFLSPLSALQTKLGPYGQQEISQIHGLSTDRAVPAPPYGWHVNGMQGPVEMDAAEEIRRSRALREAQEGESWDGMRLVEGPRRVRERGRWEEVRVGEGGEGRMF